MPAIGLCWPRNVKLELKFPGLIRKMRSQTAEWERVY
jgi:hypothetical protein